jgi:5-methylcytosine-specific restriction endonuclease McrA
MLKTCSICGRIHDFNKVCKRQNIKKKTEANNFRKSNSWKEKSIRIRQRDKYLCQVCISGKYDTTYRYTYNELEGHHIVPIAEDYSKRLDDNNLITLCRYHHEMAESGAISRKELQEIVAGK